MSANLLTLFNWKWNFRKSEPLVATEDPNKGLWTYHVL